MKSLIIRSLGFRISNLGAVVREKSKLQRTETLMRGKEMEPECLGSYLKKFHYERPEMAGGKVGEDMSKS